MLSKLKVRWKQICIALGVAVVTLILQWSADLPDPDSFYHARMLTLIADQGLLYQFPWLQQTSLNEQFTDHHLLYHLLALPWLHWTGPVMALKITQVWLVTALTLVLLGTAQYLVQRWHSSMIIAVTVLFTVAPFLVRLNLLKASALALLLFFSILFLLFKQRFAWAMLVSAVYVYAHGGFILSVVSAVCIWLGDTIARSIATKRLYFGDPRPIFTTSTGVALGLVCNPYFPNNFNFYWQQLIQIGLVNYHGVIQVGAEWYPFDQAEFVGLVSVLLIGVVGAFIVFALQYKTYLRDYRAMSLVILSIVLCMATLRSRRYIEYFVPVVWLWCSYLLLPQVWDGEWRKKIQWLRHEFGRAAWPFLGYLIFASIFNAGKSIAITYHTLHDNVDPMITFQAASTWLEQHSQEGDIVFHTNWDDWPILFYHNTKNYYLVGLDPTFMYLRNPSQYQLWRDLSSGEMNVHVASVIQQSFHARYVFVDTTNQTTKRFAAYIGRDSRAKLVFSDDTSEVYELF